MASDGRKDRRKNAAIRSQRKQRADVARRRRQAEPHTFRSQLDIPGQKQGDSAAGNRRPPDAGKRPAAKTGSAGRKHRGSSASSARRRKPAAQARRRRVPRRVQRRRRRIRIGVTLAILGVGIILGLLVFLPQFYLQDIEVRGLRLLEAEEVVRAAGLTRDNHILSYVSGSPGQILTLRYGDTETRLSERIAIAEKIRVRPKLPSRAVIAIEENTPLAYLDNGNVYALPDADGRIIATATTKPQKVPLIQGVATREYRVGDRLITTDAERLTEAVRLTDTILSLDRAVDDGHSLLNAVNTIRTQDDGMDLLYVAVPRSWLQHDDTAETGTDEPEEDASDVAPAAEGDSEPTVLGPESEATILLLVRIDRGTAGAEDLRWFRNALISHRLKELSSAVQIQEGALAFPGVLDLTGAQRSFRPDMVWP